MDVEALHREAKDRYWKLKDLASARKILLKGIDLARTQARPDLEKPLQFDLASFCWPGWDESGITITAIDLEVGERAASENMRLAVELDRGPAGMANAHFMVGAYHLAKGRYDQAFSSFNFQGEWAESGDDPAGRELARGYAWLADGIACGAVEVEPFLERLRSSEWEHGNEFAEQLQTAARVFTR